MKRAAAVLAIAALAVIAGCGDDEESTTVAETTEAETTGAGASTSSGETVKISETDFALDPSEVTVAAGTVTFEVTNDGDTTHNLEIESEDFEEELPADLAPGESGTLSVELAAGTYEMYCPVGDHADLGMTGEVTVEDSGSSGGGATTTTEDESETEDEGGTTTTTTEDEAETENESETENETESPY